MVRSIVGQPGSETAKGPEYAYPDRRAWLAAVISDAEARRTSPADEAQRAAIDVASSYVATFRPYSMPDAGHAFRLPDGSIQHDGTYAQLPRAEGYVDGDYRPQITIAIDSGGGFVRDRAGRIVRDRRRVAKILKRLRDLQRFALALLVEPASTGRKRRAPWTIARGLLFADLQPVLGTRPAARRLLAWEDELGAPWRVPGVARLVSEFEARGGLDANERDALRCAEQTMIRSCRRSGVVPGTTGSRRHGSTEAG